MLSKKSRSKRPQAHTLRNRLAQKLPAMLDAAITAYQQIAATAPPDDPKGFAAAHTAAKSALSHIDQIIKLAETAIAKDDVNRTETSDRVDELITLARSQLAKDQLNDPDPAFDDSLNAE